MYLAKWSKFRAGEVGHEENSDMVDDDSQSLYSDQLNIYLPGNKFASRFA